MPVTREGGWDLVTRVLAVRRSSLDGLPQVLRLYNTEGRDIESIRVPGGGKGVAALRTLHGGGGDERLH